MNGQALEHRILTELKGLFILLFKILSLCFAWLCKMSGMLMTKIGETIEKLIKK